VLGYYLMYLPTDDASLSPHLLMDGYWEMWITMAVARHVQPGWRCIDVGANVGYYTLLLSELVGTGGKVQAWEVQPDLAACLIRSISMNGFADIAKVCQCAASDREALVDLVPMANSWDRGSVAIEHVDPPRIETDGVCRRIDETCEWDMVDFVKIDVEGHEPQVWSGMEGILKRSPRIQVLMEFTPRLYEDAPGFLNQIRSDGFTLKRVDFHGDLQPTGPQELLDCPDMDMLWLSR
jgi:FkbM family methyltransferase